MLQVHIPLPVVEVSTALTLMMTSTTRRSSTVTVKFLLHPNSMQLASTLVRGSSGSIVGFICREIYSR